MSHSASANVWQQTDDCMFTRCACHVCLIIYEKEHLFFPHILMKDQKFLNRKHESLEHDIKELEFSAVNVQKWGALVMCIAIDLW